MEPTELPRPLADRVDAVGRVTSKAMLDAITEQRRRGRNVISLRGAPYWLPPSGLFASRTRRRRTGSKNFARQSPIGWRTMMQSKSIHERKCS